MTLIDCPMGLLRTYMYCARLLTTGTASKMRRRVSPCASLLKTHTQVSVLAPLPGRVPPGRHLYYERAEWGVWEGVVQGCGAVTG